MQSRGRGAIGHGARHPSAHRLAVARERAKLFFERRRGLHQSGRSFRRTYQMGGAAFAPAGFGADVDLEGLAFVEPSHVGAQIEHRVRALAEVEESQALGLFDPAHPGDNAGAQRLCRQICVTADEQPLWATVEGYNRSRFADPFVKVEPSLAHGARQPRPPRSDRVSCSGSPTTPVYDPDSVVTYAPARPWMR